MAGGTAGVQSALGLGISRSADLPNREASRGATRRLAPNLRLFLITCLDPRFDPAHFLGLKLSDAIAVRHVGGRVKPDVMKDVAFIGHIAENVLPDVPLFEVAVIHHTQCGASALADATFRRGYAQRIGADESELRDHAVLDPAATVTSDVRCLRSAPSIPARVAVSGHVYDVVAGLGHVIGASRRPSPSRDSRSTTSAAGERYP